MRPEKIRILTVEDLEDSIEVMAAAFFDDPLWKYLYEDRDRRRKYLYKFFKSMLSVAIDKRQAYGISPTFQGRGYATKLIVPFIMEAKQKGYSTYTETMTLENVGLYEHYGFKCIEKHHLYKKDLNVWSFCIDKK